MNKLFYKKIIIGCLVLLAWGVTSLNKVIATGSGYYEVPDVGRPVSAFSVITSQCPASLMFLKYKED